LASDQVEQIINDITGIADVDANLARTWVRDAGRRSLEARHWSFLHKRGQLQVPAAISNLTTGATVSINQNSSTLAFTSAICTPQMVGQQIRLSSGPTVVGSSGPVFDIVGYDDSSHLEIYPIWQMPNVAAQPFTIFTCYFKMPSDFMMMRSIVDIVYRRRLRTNVPRESIDRYDAARSRLGGPAALLSPLDYSPIFSGSIQPTLQIVGAGAVPTSGGVYSGVLDAIFYIQVTTGGIGGAAVFQWSKQGGAVTAGVLSDTALGNVLSDGLTVLWDPAKTYVLNDIFVIRTSSLPTIGVPRQELYPYQAAQAVFPFVYVARYPDITDDNVILPGIISRRDDVIREKALEFAATYPGTPDRPNNYAQINRRDYHATNWRQLLDELDREDNETMQENVKADPYFALPFAALPWLSGSDLQTFDPPWIYPDWPGYG
jgi:hypothetical protein